VGGGRRASRAILVADEAVPCTGMVPLREGVGAGVPCIQIPLGKDEQLRSLSALPHRKSLASAEAAYDYSSYDADVYRRELDEHRSIFDVKLGVPLSRRIEVFDDIWLRPFSSGLVIVNPSSSDRSLNFSAPLLLVNGTQVSSLHIGPRRGFILIGDSARETVQSILGQRLNQLALDIEQIESMGGNVTSLKTAVDRLSSQGDWNLTYLFQQVGELEEEARRTKALAYIDRAERLIQLAKTQGIDTRREELFVEGARRAYEKGNWDSVTALCEYPLKLEQKVHENSVGPLQGLFLASILAWRLGFRRRRGIHS